MFYNAKTNDSAKVTGTQDFVTVVIDGSTYIEKRFNEYEEAVSWLNARGFHKRQSTGKFRCKYRRYY